MFAYMSFRKNNKDIDFKFFKSDVLAYTMSGIALVLSCTGFLGAGLDYVVGASGTEAILLIVKTYGGPLILIAMGLVIRFMSQKSYNKSNKGRLEDKKKAV